MGDKRTHKIEMAGLTVLLRDIQAKTRMVGILTASSLQPMSEGERLVSIRYNYYYTAMFLILAWLQQRTNINDSLVP